MNVSKIASKIGTEIKKVKPLDIATKGAGALALLSVLNESNKIGANNASQESKVYEANKAIKLGIGAGKLNYESTKYSATKEFIRRNYPYEIGKTWHGFKGYLEGFSKGAINNIMTVAFSALALVSKHKTAKVVSMIGLLGSIGFNFVNNGTNLLEKTNQLE